VNAIYIVFKETKFMTLLRSERYGFIDFISNCGGLMGLFMGISILSIVEIFYYTAAFVNHLIFKLCFRNNRVHHLNWQLVFFGVENIKLKLGWEVVFEITFSSYLRIKSYEVFRQLWVHLWSIYYQTMPHRNRFPLRSAVKRLKERPLIKGTHHLIQGLKY
jgi:hypothetical protein